MIMDVVAEFYSKPQIGGGAMRVMRGMQRNYSIPIVKGKREQMGRAAQGIEEAVLMAGGKAVKQFARAKGGADGEPTKIDPNQLRQTLANSGTSIIAKTLRDFGGKTSSKEGASKPSRALTTPKKSSKKKKTTKKSKHKRSKIDDVLGDDHY